MAIHIVMLNTVPFQRVFEHGQRYLQRTNWRPNHGTRDSQAGVHVYICLRIKACKCHGIGFAKADRCNLERLQAYVCSLRCGRDRGCQISTRSQLKSADQRCGSAGIQYMIYLKPQSQTTNLDGMANLPSVFNQVQSHFIGTCMASKLSPLDQIQSCTLPLLWCCPVIWMHLPSLLSAPLQPDNSS